ncbi:CehA/McbA family metallohydrolase, partial [Candidatus Aerophobetes bacterium]|nr:CehA/McbA family metallohydrolase [Candidatus Aerophobetes bacterium]
IAIDRENSGVYKRIAKFPVLEVVGNYIQRFYVKVRPIQRVKKSFYIKVIPIDKAGNPASNYKGKIKFICSDPKGIISPSVHCFKERQGDFVSVEGKLFTPGIHTITVIDEEKGFIGRSNPILISNSSYEHYNLFFGDIHGHNVHCDGRGTIDEYYRWARDVRFLDFCALTNHIEGAKRFPVENFWNTVKIKAAEYNDPGHFVTFLAFEWGSWELFGDKCVYYLSEDEDYFPANEERSNTPEKLWNLLRGKSALTIAHHTKYGGKTDWNFQDDELQPLAEIYSVWGSSETGSEHSIQKAWEKGHRLGVIASSDTHTGTPGNEGEGLAAVWAHDLTRESLFEAFRQRRCYGTTGARIIMDFRLNNCMMGESLNLKNNKSRKISIFVAGTAPIEKIEVLKNNRVAYVHPGYGSVENFDWIDNSVKELLSWGGEFYYVRVVQVDGEMAWSSPIWIF